MVKSEKEIKELLESIRRNAMLYGTTPVRVVVIKCLEWVLDENEEKKKVVHENQIN